jgi:hypothetical protein
MSFRAKFRIVPLLLASLIFMNCLGVYLIAFAQTSLHRISEYVHSSGTSATLTLTTDEWAQVNWIGERDFVYNGNVYDMNSFSAVNGKVKVNVSVDAEERNTIDRLADNDTHQKQTSLPSLKDIFKSISECEDPSFINFSMSVPSSAAALPLYTAPHSSVIRTVTAPPPRVA